MHRTMCGGQLGRLDAGKEAAGEGIWINGADMRGQVDLLDRGFAGVRMAMLLQRFEVFYRKAHQGSTD